MINIVTWDATERYALKRWQFLWKMEKADFNKVIEYHHILCYNEEKVDENLHGNHLLTLQSRKIYILPIVFFI